MIKAIIFDCFGVLITDGLEALIQKLEKTQPDIRDYIFDIIRQSNAGLIKPADSDRIIAEYLGSTDKNWRQQISAGEVRNEELVEWIKVLRKQYKVALLSNTGQGSLKRRFTDEELHKWFDEIIVSADEGMVKPDPGIYKLAAERLGVNCNECVFFDDRPHHVEGALAVGMHAFLFTTVKRAKTDLEALLANPES